MLIRLKVAFRIGFILQNEVFTNYLDSIFKPLIIEKSNRYSLKSFKKLIKSK